MKTKVDLTVEAYKRMERCIAISIPGVSPAVSPNFVCSRRSHSVDFIFLSDARRDLLLTHRILRTR
jgi:hypothetical protein